MGIPAGVTPVEAALKGLCPRCGARTLFAGIAKFAPSCRACQLDFSAFNVGDGPAAFLTLGIGALITILAVTVELAFEPPFIVHVLLWVPITAAAVAGSLRFTKGMLLAMEWSGRHAPGAAGDGRNSAGQGRIRDE